MVPHAVLADLHTPLLPILRHVLALAPLLRTGLALDLACGPGLKIPLLAEACGPDVRLVGIDIDRVAIRAMTTDLGPPTADSEQDIETGRQGELPNANLPVSSSPYPPVSHSSVVGRRSSVVGIVGDALALPLREGCCDAAFCIAALGLFADRLAALRELRRVLAPGAPALLIVGTQMWTQMVPWPADLAARLAAAYAQALADGAAPLPATPDLGGGLIEMLLEAGFDAPFVRAFQLDPLLSAGEPRTENREPRTENREPDEGQITQHTTCDTSSATDHGPRTTDSALAAELPLLYWPGLRSLLAGSLDRAELARCDLIARGAEIALCSLALAALARAA